MIKRLSFKVDTHSSNNVDAYIESEINNKLLEITDIDVISINDRFYDGIYTVIIYYKVENHTQINDN
jgi:hypothetical protein